MTNAQRDAIEKIRDIMREHFDAGLAVLTTDTENDEITATELIFHGGYDRGIGLAEIGKIRLLNRQFYSDPPPSGETS
jgi:hypothetical protein